MIGAEVARSNSIVLVLSYEPDMQRPRILVYQMRGEWGGADEREEEDDNITHVDDIQSLSLLASRVLRRQDQPRGQEL